MLVVNYRLWGPILLLSIAGGVLGYFFEQQSPGVLSPHAALVGAVAGAVLGFPIGLLFQQQKRRWVAGAALAVILIIAYAYGGPWDALLAATSAVIVYFVSAAVLRDLYGGNEMEAFWHHLRILFAARGGMLIIEEGAVTVPAGKGPHMGPMRVIVKPGNAVVMESGSRTTRICGPSVFQSNNFEYVKAIYMLNRERRSITLTDVMSNDLVPVEAELTYVCGIDVSQRTIRGENGSISHSDGSQGITETELQTLKNLVTAVPDWKPYLHAITRSAIREIIAQKTYDDLIQISNYGELASQIQERIRRRTAILGIRVDSVRLLRISPPEQVRTALSEAEGIRTRERAAALAWRESIQLIAEGYNLAGITLTPEEVRLEIHRRMLEHIAHDDATKIVIAADPRDVQRPSSVVDGVIDTS